MAAITNPDELRAWLEGKPATWSAAIALRVALRIIPLACNPAYFKNGTAHGRLTTAVFRCGALSWVAGNSPTPYGAAAGRASGAVDHAARAVGASRVLDAAASAVARASLTADAANAPGAYPPRTAGNFATDAADYAARAAWLTAFAADAALWDNIDGDCQFIGRLDFSEDAARASAQRLHALPLWTNAQPTWFTEEYAAMRAGFTKAEQGFDLWLDWYDRRVRGGATGFALPPEQDAEISRRLVAADDEWWQREPALVNADIQAWIDELTPPPSATLGDLSPEPQNPRSPVFGSSEDGKVVIIGHAGVEQLRRDDQAQVRHTAARAMALSLGAALQGNNAAGYITALADDYIAALGAEVGDTNPSLAVLHGERLRRAIAAHAAAGPADDLVPLPTDGARAADSFVAAHNMMVGLDPFLDTMDRATLGPDVAEPMAVPADVRAVAAALHDDGVLADATQAVMIEAVDLAPDVPDAANRNSRFLTGLTANFARYAIEFLVTYPLESAVVIGLGALAGAATVGLAATGIITGSVVSTTAIAYHLARNILANEDVYRRWAGSSPANQGNLDRIIAFLKTLPIKSLKHE
ncbi:MAG: hypothetical protein ABL882_03865 [Sphingopyxis sp.]